MEIRPQLFEIDSANGTNQKGLTRGRSDHLSHSFVRPYIFWTFSAKFTYFSTSIAGLLLTHPGFCVDTDAAP